VPLGLAGLAALGGYGYYLRTRRTRQNQSMDSSFIESRIQPDSFFGSSGGQHIDTNDSTEELSIGSAASSSYSSSQMDAAGDVDPVAEADVYLAYGRDIQAEEILKEALRTNPARLAIYSKLLEIYAKRRDVRAFASSAREAYKLSSGEGAEWERICELGREIDSSNPFYQASSDPDPIGAAFGSSTLPPSLPTDFSELGTVDLDLGDLGLDMDAEVEVEQPAVSFELNTAAVPRPTTEVTQPIAAPPRSAPAPAQPALADLSFDLNLPAPAPAPTPVAPKAAPAPAAAAPSDSGMIEFDLGALAMDFSPSSKSPSTKAPAAQEPAQDLDNPMVTKLELAQEFHAIGDTEGARALIEEVIAGSTGPLRAKAQRFLIELS
jgi:pilus assembly protein FimV